MSLSEVDLKVLDTMYRLGEAGKKPVTPQQIATNITLEQPIVEDLLAELVKDQYVEYVGAGGGGSHRLTSKGRLAISLPEHAKQRGFIK